LTGLTLVRRIAARPSIVFEALTTADGIATWWGPDDLPGTVAEIDARVGGAFRVRFRTLDGLEHEACGECLEVVPPSRLVMSWRFSAGGEPEELDRVSRVAFELRPIDGGVELTLTHADLRNEISAASHQRGWVGSLVKLGRLLGEMPEPSDHNVEHR
jgi:uncharacterized protein YndB with AHSA1/START domain